MVHQLGDFAIDEIAGISKYLHAAVVGTLDRRGAVIFLQEHATAGAGGLQYIEAVVAKPGDSFFKRFGLNFLGHSSNEP